MLGVRPAAVLAGLSAAWPLDSRTDFDGFSLRVVGVVAVLEQQGGPRGRAQCIGRSLEPRHPCPKGGSMTQRTVDGVIEPSVAPATPTWLSTGR